MIRQWARGVSPILANRSTSALAAVQCFHADRRAWQHISYELDIVVGHHGERPDGSCGLSGDGPQQLRQLCGHTLDGLAVEEVSVVLDGSRETLCRALPAAAAAGANWLQMQ